MTPQDKEAISRTCMTPGWRLIVQEMQSLIENYKQAAFDCREESEVLEHWRRSQVAQELFDAFLDPLVKYRLPESD